MKRILLILVYCLCPFWLFGQEGTVTIEGQILGYKGKESIGYTLHDYFRLDSYEKVKPDSLGRFVITEKINGTSLFSLIYLKDTAYHSCKLIVEPGNHYSFISKGHNKNDLKHYTPDVYTLFKKENTAYFKRDLGQMFYNLIDNNTRGALYREDWDLMHPDALLPTLIKRINTQVSILNDLLVKGEVNKKFYHIARLGSEYTQAYRLAETIRDFMSDINDSVITTKLLEIYPKIFEMYPVNKNVDLQYYQDFDKYVDLYLDFLSRFKSGKFEPYKEILASGDEPFMHAKGYLNEQAYSTYSFIQAVNNMAAYGPDAGNYAREIVKEHPDMNQEIRDTYEGLLARVDKFDSLAYVDFPKNVIIIDEKEPVNSFSQLISSLENKPALVDIWGTWCIVCRGQFQFQDDLKPFLDKNGIKKVYIAFEYGDTRKVWGILIKGYKLEGYHFIANENFKSDLEKYTGKILKFPTYLIIDKEGNIVEKDAYTPSEYDKLITQLKEKLNL